MNKKEWDLDLITTDIGIRMDWKLKMIQEHLRGIKWHQDCIERLEKEMLELDKKLLTKE